MPKVKCTKEERAEAIKTLRKLCRPGSTVYTILRHRSSSGMMRRISLVVINKGDTRQIDYLAAKVTGRSIDDRKEGIVVHGCGMDMGFELVYCLSRTLYPKGGSLKATNATRRYQAEQGGDTRETNGGYLLNQRWL